MKIILSTEKLCKTFSAGGVQQHVLKNLDVEIYEGDFTVIMGPSGAGKSTLLYALSGMDKPTLGEVRFAGAEIAGLSNDRLAVFRRDNCGFVFQQTYLLDNMSIMDNIMACGLLVEKNKKTVAARAGELLTKLNLDEQTWRKFPSQVSGGEGQRAGIARALINSPKILFADEPTGSLNSANGRAVLDALTEVNRAGRGEAEQGNAGQTEPECGESRRSKAGNGNPEQGNSQSTAQSIVMVTHDIASARRGNRILYFRDGTICGELKLGEYIPNSAARHEKLRNFLSEMGW